MAGLVAGKHFGNNERVYSSEKHNDDSSMLSYRYDKYRNYAPYVREGSTELRTRRSFTGIAKFSLFCTAMILFCFLMYIPVYNKASDHITKGFVAGWSAHTNRDTKIYVQPNNVTTVHEPKSICHKESSYKKNNLFLLIVVSSAIVNIDQRNAIRDTWGNYKKYLQISKIFNVVREKYKQYNYSYDLYSDVESSVSVNNSRIKRDISLDQLLPELAKALQSKLVNVETDKLEKRFEDDNMLPEFDMNKELGEFSEEPLDYDYPSNIMRIPPRGYEDNLDLSQILSLLKRDKIFPKIAQEYKDYYPDFKVVFLLGLPSANDTGLQEKIKEEVETHGDIIQEGFIDSYNNLTLKSIMMLKWITNKCNDSVRYILKTDDDMYVNVPNLMTNLRNRSKNYDAKVAKGHKKKEYVLIGDLICGARPVLDSNNKWYSPRYMYRGRVYPRYLSGTGYVMSSATASALYEAALRTNYFHLEDIYITGLCAFRASPRLSPRDDPQFSFAPAPAHRAACAAHARATLHHLAPALLRRVHHRLANATFADRCERMRLTQIKDEDRRLYVIYKYIRLLVTNEC